MKKKTIFTSLILALSLTTITSCNSLLNTKTTISSGTETTTSDVDSTTTVSTSDNTPTSSSYDLFETDTTTSTKANTTTTISEGPIKTSEITTTPEVITSTSESNNTTTIYNTTTSENNVDTTTTVDSYDTSTSVNTTVDTMDVDTSNTSTTENVDTTTTIEDINTDTKLKLIESNSYAEGAYLITNVLENTTLSDYTAYYKKSTDSTYQSIDSELVRIIDGNIRVDYLGLAKGTYNFMLSCDTKNVSVVTDNININNYDRSGYSHFKDEANDSTKINVSNGIGAYNNDGTLKEDTVVVYVSNATKNTVTAKINNKTYTGISSIMQAQSKSSVALDIRILDTIEAATWNSLTVSNYYDSSTKKGVNPETAVMGQNGEYLDLQSYTEEQIIDGGFNTLDESKYTKLDGLTNSVKYDESKLEFDSYYNMLDITSAKNVTVEGVGDSAGLFQWGFTWKNSSSIEVRNLLFDDYTEDACSFEGSDKSATSISSFNTGHIWIHQNTFNEGINYWDVCSEQDKHEGDGATDFKGLAYVTISYNHYYKNHKTGLVGGSDSHTSANFTFHHNYYDTNASRLPFARQANMHMYNNYYYNSTGNNMQVYAGAYAFIENCYFKGTANTYIVKESTSGTGTPAVKSYNNTYDSCKNYDGATIVNSRDTKVSSGNKFGQNFDTDSSIFYYDSETGKSDVDVLNDTADVPTYVVNHAGRLGDSKYSGDTTNEVSIRTAKEKTTSDEITYDESLFQTVYEDDFSTSSTISLADSFPTDSGIYYHIADTEATASNVATSSDNVTISNGTLNINDTSATTTTWCYYVFSESYTTGVVRYSIDFTPTTLAGSWSIIQFIGEDSTLGIRSNSSKYLGYTLDNTNVTNIQTSAYTLTTHTVILTVDYDNQKAYISIDGSEVEVSGYSFTAVNGIKLMTAKKDTARSFSVDNIKLEKYIKED